MSAKPMRRAAHAAAPPPIYQLEIALADIEPSIWRRIRVRGDIWLDRLHPLLQKTMGWRNTHLHEWIVDGRRYGEPVPDEPHYQVEDEMDLTLRLVAPVEGVRFEYLYDFGDGWRHEIVVERIDSPGRRAVTPLCLGGERACPPEDCGGPDGYRRFLEAIRDRRHPEHEDMLSWVGGSFDPEKFGVAAVNRQLRRFT